MINAARVFPNCKCLDEHESHFLLSFKINWQLEDHSNAGHTFWLDA